MATTNSCKLALLFYHSLLSSLSVHFVLRECHRQSALEYAPGGLELITGFGALAGLTDDASQELPGHCQDLQTLDKTSVFCPAPFFMARLIGARSAPFSGSTCVYQPGNGRSELTNPRRVYDV